jgi:hypothetical protein
MLIRFVEDYWSVLQYQDRLSMVIGKGSMNFITCIKLFSFFSEYSFSEMDQIMFSTGALNFRLFEFQKIVGPVKKS